MKRILFIILCFVFVPVVCFAEWEIFDTGDGLEFRFSNEESVTTYYVTDGGWETSSEPAVLGTNAEIDSDVYLTVMEGHADVPTDPDVWGEPDEEVHTSSEWATISAGQAELNTEMMFDINGMGESMDFMGIYLAVFKQLLWVSCGLCLILIFMWVVKMALQYINDEKVTEDFGCLENKFKWSESNTFGKTCKLFLGGPFFLSNVFFLFVICFVITTFWPLVCLLLVLYIPLRTARFLNRVKKGLGKIAKVAHKHVDNLNQQDIEIEGPKF